MVWAVAFAPKGALLASASQDQTVRLWTASEQTEVATLKGHANEVWSVAFSADGSRLATGDRGWENIPLAGPSRSCVRIGSAADGIVLAFPASLISRRRWPSLRSACSGLVCCQRF